jgi:hypothetical protein
MEHAINGAVFSGAAAARSGLRSPSPHLISKAVNCGKTEIDRREA